MSEENVELIRRWLDDWNREDFDAFFALFDRDAELIADPSWPESGSFKGRGAIKTWYEGLWEAWAGKGVVVVSDLLAVEAATVIVRLHWEVRGRISGIDTDLDVTSVNRVERGKIVRQQWYFDHRAALEAVGLTE